MKDDLEGLFAALEGGALTRDARAEAEALAALALAVPPAAPPVGGLADLLAAIDAPTPFAHFIGAVADLLAVSREGARAALAKMRDAAAWVATTPGVELLHLPPGDTVAGTVVGFVRVAPGEIFPHHAHVGDEHVFVLQGGFVDSDGHALRAGQGARRPPGSPHALKADAGDPLIYVAVVFGGVEFGEPDHDAR